MTIEDQITALTVAMEKLTETVEKQNGILSGGIAKGGAAASKPAAAEKKTTTKSSTSKSKKLTKDDVGTAFATYLKVKDEDEHAERKENVRRVAQKFGEDRVTLVDEAHYQDMLDMLAMLEKGEDPFDGEEDGEEEDSVV